MWVEPITLEGKFVRLEPMTEEHAYRLFIIGNDPSIWRYMLYGELTTEQSMLAWVRDMLARKAAGTDQPFVVIHKESGMVAGATATWKFALRIVVWKLAGRGTASSSSAPPSTPKPNTCSCATPLRPWAQSASN